MKYQLEDKGAGMKLKCPKCDEWLYLDEDQLYGRISTWHDIPECGFHETIDFSKYFADPKPKEKA